MPGMSENHMSGPEPHAEGSPTASAPKARRDSSLATPRSGARIRKPLALMYREVHGVTIVRMGEGHYLIEVENWAEV